MKKILCIGLLLMFTSSVYISAQEENIFEKTANVKSNWISAGVTVAGVGIKYEHMFNSYWSLGADAYHQYCCIAFFDGGFAFPITLLDFNTFITARGYPLGKYFYIGIGIGYHFGSVFINGVLLAPEVGAKIDIGRPGGFFMDFCVKVPQMFGLGRYAGYYSMLFVPFLGFGGAF